MAKEIERKFLVIGDDWRRLAVGVPYRQGYLSTVKERTVRVRTIGDRGVVTIKGLTRDVSRLEFEYEIPVDDARQILDLLCERPLIEKIRHTIHLGSVTWEIDEFTGENHGLIVAEVELISPGQHLDRPSWIGQEVSSDPRYFNANLVSHPYNTWKS